MSDLISRQQAIDALKAIKYGLWEIDIPSPTVPEYVEHHEQIKNMMEIVDGWIERIQEEPPIQPKRGRWHYSDGKPARIGMSFGVICDQCGTESEYCTNFCGECGADMREVNNESN